jgi:hypothetical protein
MSAKKLSDFVCNYENMPYLRYLLQFFIIIVLTKLSDLKQVKKVLLLLKEERSGFDVRVKCIIIWRRFRH